MCGNKRNSITSVPTFVVLLSILISAVCMHVSSIGVAAATFTAHPIILKPIYIKYKMASSAIPTTTPFGKVLFPCQSNDNPQPVLCYGPDQLRAAYNVQPLLKKGITGKGSSVTIVDVFGSPTIVNDLKAFDAAWGLPDPKINIYTPFGIGGSDFGWAVETTLDVEWSHVMAPGAVINLVIARTNADVDIYDAIKYAVDNNIGDTLSQSFGENEACADPALVAAQHQVYREAAQKGISVFAASGDNGSAQFTCDSSALVEAVSFPADDSLVTAVGGTRLTADAVKGNYIGETAWNESGVFDDVASGGGFSSIYARPSYQNGVTNRLGSGRGVPDVALNASINGGILVFITDPSTGQLLVLIVGGTSVSSPEWAGIIADGVQSAGHRLGFLNAGISKLGKSSKYATAFHDITSGDNILIGSGIPGSHTLKGWDAVTGWGTPKAASLVSILPSFLNKHDVAGL